MNTIKQLRMRITQPRRLQVMNTLKERRMCPKWETPGRRAQGAAPGTIQRKTPIV